MTNATLTIPAQIKAQIKALGSTKEEILATLVRENIKGRRMDTQECPIAIYFKNHNPGHFISVGVTGMTVDHGPERYRLPFVLSDFISAIDSGQIPEVVKEWW